MEDSSQSNDPAATPNMPQPPKPVLYYVLKDGVQTGPYDMGKINEMIAAGELAAEVMVWTDGMAKWKPVSEVGDKPVDMKALAVSAAQKTKDTASKAVNKIAWLVAQHMEGKPNKKTLKIAGIVAACIVVLLAVLLMGGGKSAQAEYEEGLAYTRAKNYSAAIEHFKNAAESGHARAQLYLGKAYMLGRGTEKNPEEAFKWFKKSADQGVAEAQFFLGRAYMLGEGTAMNETEGFKWFIKAAEQGDADAQCFVGVCYKLGMGVEKSISDAVRWFRAAARQGHQDAAKELRNLER